MSNDVDYETSNSIWIRDLPSTWKVKRFKYLTQSRKEVSATGDEELLSVTEVRGIVKRRELKSNHESLSRAEDLTGYRHVKKGDLVSNIMLVWKRGLGVSSYNGIVSPAYSVFTFSDECYPNYYNYLVRSDEYVTEFRKHSTGITMSRLRLYDDSFRTVFAHVPPIEEQKLISRYLDKKTEQIDCLIQKIQKKIELLTEQKKTLINQYVTKGLDPNVEMKNSGVEWINEIPKHWKLGRFKYYISILTDYTANGSFKSLADNIEYLSEGYSRLVRLTDLRKDLQNDGIYLSIESHNFLKKSELFGNEILIANVGAYTGLALKMKSKKGVFTLGPNMFLVRNNNEMSNVDYLVYLINSYSIKTAIDLVISSTAQPKINKDNLKSLVVPIPPKKEQEEIAVALNEKLKTIDNIIDRENKRVLLLQECKQSIISCAVTGKVRLKEDMI